MPTVIGIGVTHIRVEYLFCFFFVLPLAHFLFSIIISTYTPIYHPFCWQMGQYGWGEGQEESKKAGKRSFCFSIWDVGWDMICLDV